VVRVLDEDELENLITVQPLRELRVGQILGVLQVVVFYLLFGVVVGGLDLRKDVFKLSHSTNAFLEERAGQILFGEDQLIGF